MITAEVDYSVFNRGMKGLIHDARLNARDVVKKETGEVIKTLVRISPPKEPGKTRAKIKANISGRFDQLRSDDTGFDRYPGKQGSTGIKWYAASSKFLFGGAADSDMRKASQPELLSTYYRLRTIGPHQRVVVPFKNRKTAQRVAILTKIVTRKSQVNVLVKRIQGHVGRLKAAWLPAIVSGKIKITGAFLPPKWISRHTKGALGTFIDETQNWGNPQFTIINFAKGVTSKVSAYWLQAALNIRGKAMAKNALLFMKGKKHVGDYGTGKRFRLN